MREKLLLAFSEKLFVQQDINLAKLDNQLQIAFQILINKGCEVLVSGDGELSFEFAKKFSYIFQDNHIRATENILDNSQKYGLIQNSDCVTCFQKEFIQLAQSLNKNCIFIDIEAKNAGERSDVRSNFSEFILEDLNAGEIVRRIGELVNNLEKTENECNFNRREVRTSIKSDIGKNLNEEFEEYKNQLKRSIEKLINAKQLIKAKNTIEEYENIVDDDADIYSMKAIILIMEGNLEESEKILKKAISIYKNNFDLLYNLAYIYKLKQSYFEAKKYYLKSKELTNDEKILAEIQNSLSEIEE